LAIFFYSALVTAVPRANDILGATLLRNHENDEDCGCGTDTVLKFGG
jgi:hypothetical protein